MIKAVVNGLLKLESPLLISSGENLQSDQDFVLDSQGRPFIPGTSLTGSLRNEVCKYFRANLIFNKDELEDILALFWGREEILLQKDINNRNQSSVIISNCYLENVSEIPIPIRDGIKIDNRIGIAEDKKKFNYQLLEIGHEFSFKMELKIVNGKNINETEKTENDILDYFETILIYIINILTSGNFSIGAKTNQGFGKVKLEKEEYLKYDLSTMQVWDWLLKTDSKKNEIKTLQDKNKIIHLNIFKISFKAKIDSSLIIGDSHPQAIAQKFHLKSNNEPILSGSSLKGAVRARAEKILRTIGFNLDNEQNLFWINFFGHEGDSKIKEQARKSRLSVTESFFEKKPNEELQSRIKIDRFTGGTIEGALFDSVPLFQNKDNTACVTFEINIRDFNNDKQEDKAAAGLLLLVLKDLWTSDLPIGGEKNVGRGRLRGVGATISFPLLYIGDSSDAKSDVLIELKLDENGNPQTTEKNWEQLEGFVLALNNLVGKP